MKTVAFPPGLHSIMLFAGISAKSRTPVCVHTGPSVHLSKPVTARSTAAFEEIRCLNAGSSVSIVCANMFWVSAGAATAAMESMKKSRRAIFTHKFYRSAADDARDGRVALRLNDERFFLPEVTAEHRRFARLIEPA